MPFQEKKLELDVKESFLVFKIIGFFNFQYSHNRFPAVRVLSLKNNIMYLFTPKTPVRHSDSNAERELYTLLIY